MKDKEQTKVVFRKFKDGEIIALFPEIVSGYNILSYMHTGQHGEASPLLVSDTKPATKAEYLPLFRELSGLGYNLRIMRRMRVRF
jgi:hypothetical protein